MLISKKITVSKKSTSECYWFEFLTFLLPQCCSQTSFAGICSTVLLRVKVNPARCAGYFVLQILDVFIYFGCPLPPGFLPQQFPHSIGLLERLFMNFDKCWIEPRKNFKSLAFFGTFNFVIASVLSFIGFTRF